MEPTSANSFTLWLRAANPETDMLPVAGRIAVELERNGQPVELVDAAALARETYRNKLSGQGLALAIGMTVTALNRHGIACVVHGALKPSSELSWKKRKPEKLLDVVLAREGELKPPPEPQKTGPFLVLRPGGSTRQDTPPDPPSSAPVGETPGAGDSSTAASEEKRAATPLEAWDVEPLFDALSRAGWIEGRGESNGADDDALLRKRLRDLGYL